jgi:hypothetical protein
MSRRRIRSLVVVLAVTALLLGAAAAGAKTIVGTDGPDRLVGTRGADALYGRGGNDTLIGLAGNDLLVAGPGRDRVDAGPGTDRVSVEYDGSRPDTVTCGPGIDTVTADPVDRVSADCELVARRISRDPYTNPESQHESEVEPDSYTFGGTTVAVFQVGRRFDGGASNIGYAVSTNDGRTWRNGLLPGLTTLSLPPGTSSRASDPVVAYDAAHQVWIVSTLAIGDTTRLAINTSPDGVTWSGATAAAEESATGGSENIAFDKNWIACDNGRSSPFFGRCYLVYTHSAANDELEIRTSDDGGRTWSAPTDGGVRPVVGVIPVIRPNGDVVLVYLWETSQFAISASRSSDGGLSFGAPVRIANVTPTSGCGVQGFRMFPLPSADVDATGRIAAAWQDCLGEEPTSRVFVATSSDGIGWSSASAVTSGPSALLPAVGIDPESGRVAIAYYRLLSSGMVAEFVEAAGAGAPFGPSRRLTALPMQLAWMPRTTTGRMLGDYISVTYAGGRPLVVWVLASPPVGASLRQAVYATRG